jgi:heat shock protein HtpX
MIQNQIKTVILLGLLTALLLWVGSLLGGFSGLTIAFVFAIVMNFGAYFLSDKIVLFMYQAKEVKQGQAPRLFKIIKEVTELAQIPMPRVYIIPSDASNAFATGRNYKHAAVACTRGILALMKDDELKGVLAHEISHIKNRDILIQTVAATIAGVISYVAMMARYAAIFGGAGRDKENNNIIELLVLGILTPIMAMFIQLAISRSREYLADESAAKTLHNPSGLANALEKLDKEAKNHPLLLGGRATSSLFIVNPFSAKGFMNMLSTHPPIEERVKRLRHMHF